MANSSSDVARRGIWREIRIVAERILTDTLVVLLLLAAITAVYSLLDQVSYLEHRKKLFSTLHYYSCLIIAAMFLSDVIFAVACFLYSKSTGGNGTEPG
jgi:hypothetical protein